MASRRTLSAFFLQSSGKASLQPLLDKLGPRASKQPFSLDHSSIEQLLLLYASSPLVVPAFVDVHVHSPMSPALEASTR